MKQFLHNNSLSLILFGLFASMLIGMSVVGLRHENSELIAHGQPTVSYFRYATSGSFSEAVFENWESEFLQMGAYVLLTVWFRQKGSKDSKKQGLREAIDAPSRYSLLHSPWRQKGRALRSTLYSNSLSLALFGIFVLCLLFHMVGGAHAFNQEAIAHNEATLSTWRYATTAQFWFESLQNWQSEFLAIGTLIVLTIFLRQRHSPESKPVSKPNSATGE